MCRNSRLCHCEACAASRGNLVQELLKPYKPVHPYRLPLMRSADSRAGSTTAVPAFCEKILQDIKKGLTSAQRYDILSEQSKSTYARVVELADSLDSGSSVHSGRAGSSPASRTNSSDSSEFEEFFFIKNSVFSAFENRDTRFLPPL